MQVLLLGVTGTIGRRIAGELKSRGHQVTGGSRTGTAIDGVTPAVVDPTNPKSVAAAAAGKDAIISSVHIDPDNNIAVTLGVLDGARQAGVRRILNVGGAGSLEVAPGVQLLDAPAFPEEYKAVARAHRDTLPLWRASEDLDWTYISPPAMIAPGKRTGTYRVGGDQLLADAEGNSAISAEDYAMALVDELEKGDAIRKRITVAY